MERGSLRKDGPDKWLTDTSTGLRTYVADNRSSSNLIESIRTCFVFLK